MMEPVGVTCGTDVPQLTSSQVLKSLATIKKTASGPDGIPYWVWRDYADVLAPVVLIEGYLNINMHKRE